MKYKNIILIFATSFLLITCAKKPFDYRNKYCGRFTFDYTETQWYANNGIIGEWNKVSTGEVYYNKKDPRDRITIRFDNIDVGLSVLALEVAINHKGQFSSCGTQGQFPNKNSITLTFETAKCDINPGGGYSYTLTGMRQN